jgi:uncharacterized membrane protein YuzA (DUF378 family)
MKKVIDFFNKYSDLILGSGAAAWLIVGVFGFDVIGHIFLEINLYFLVRLVYIAIGLAGIYKLLEKYRPDLLEKILGKKK